MNTWKNGEAREQEREARAQKMKNVWKPWKPGQPLEGWKYKKKVNFEVQTLNK